MSAIWIMVLVAIVVVGFFVVGLSLTLIFKGHNIESEIGDNPNMKKLGIQCAAQQIRQEEQVLRGGEVCDNSLDCSADGCASCGLNGK